MVRIKYCIFFVFLLSGIAVYSQPRVFWKPEKGTDAFRMKVVKNDTVIVSEDSAYVYSMAMVEKIGNLEQLYLSCLTLRDKDLVQIDAMITSLQGSYAKVEDILKKSSNLNRDQADQFRQQIAVIISNLRKDVDSLEELEKRLDASKKELEEVKSEVKKLRQRLWWQKTGGVIVAAALGVAAGIALASF